MRILIVAATNLELNPIKEGLGLAVDAMSANFKQHQLDFLVTGVGMVATAFELGEWLSENQYDLAINIGVAGAFDRSIELGEVLEVETDFFPEMGAEDEDSFLTIHDLELIEKDDFPYEGGKINAKHQLTLPSSLRKVNGITVNKVHGNEASIAKLLGTFKAEVESMEGAAFLYACRNMGVDCVQLRGISNYVEKRNRSSWKIPLALENLTSLCLNVLNDLE